MGILQSNYKVFKQSAQQKIIGFGPGTPAPVIINYGCPPAGTLWKVRRFSYFDNATDLGLPGIQDNYNVSLVTTVTPVTSINDNSIEIETVKNRFWNSYRPDNLVAVPAPGDSHEFKSEFIVSENTYLGMVALIDRLALAGQLATLFTTLQVEELNMDYFRKHS